MKVFFEHGIPYSWVVALRLFVSESHKSSFKERYIAGHEILGPVETIMQQYNMPYESKSGVGDL